MLLNKGNLNNIILPKKIIFSSFDFKLELLEFWLFILLHIKPGFYSISIETDFIYINGQWFHYINKNGKSNCLFDRICTHWTNLLKNNQFFFVSFLAFNKSSLNDKTHKDVLFNERIMLISMSYFLKQPYSRSYYYVNPRELRGIFNYVISSSTGEVFNYYICNKKHLKWINNIFNKVCR